MSGGFSDIIGNFLYYLDYFISMRVTWFGHSSVKVETGSQVIYVDPFAGPDSWYTPGTLVLVSAFHFDHCSVAKLRRACSDSTHILGTSELVSNVFPAGLLHPGESRFFDGVEIVGMPVKKKQIDYKGHVHEQISRLGFVIIAENKKVYFMGDSDFLPQTERMVPDVLFISVGGTYTSAPKEAAMTASLISPKLAIPIHWGGPVGTRDDALLFSELAQCAVKILGPGESIEV